MLRKKRASRLVLVAAAVVGMFQEAAAQSGPVPRVRFPGGSVVIPMANQSGRSLVQVRIGNTGPYDFLIDTGAGTSVIDAQLASRLGLQIVGQTAVGVPGGQRVETDRVRVPVMTVGDLVIEGTEPVAIDIANMTGGVMYGVLGLEVFRDVLLVLDQSAGRAVVSRGALAPNAPGSVAFEVERGQMNFEIDVAGHRVPAHIDTGSPAGLTLPIEMIDVVPTVPDTEVQTTAGLVGGQRHVRVRLLDGAVRFAGLTFEDLRVGFMDPSPGAANIGSGLLADLVVTIDQRNRLLSFRPSSGSAERVIGDRQTSAPRRLGLQLAGAPGTGLSQVRYVEPGSLADQAGFAAGDAILSVNGRAIAEYDRASLGSLFGSADPLRFEVERNGARHVIEIR